MPKPMLHQWPKEMPDSVRDLATNNPPKEGAVQICAWLADRVKVREVGRNAGYWVLLFLGAVGLSGGYAWCAAVQFYVNVLVGLPVPPKGGAAVINWRNWARANGTLISPKDAVRGDLVGWVNPNGSGHIERKYGIRGTTRLLAFGGNTSGTASGDQREGDGFWRKDRAIDDYDFAIRMP